jgi:prephenate dehydrogenase
VTPASEPAAPEATVGDAQVLSSVLVVGAGLIGTSVGLALSAHGVTVYLSDRDAAAAALAEDLGAGLAQEPTGEPDLVVLATPPAAIADVLIKLDRLYLQATFTDLASVKSVPQQEIEAIGADASRFVGGHPLAGRERSGAGAARADLFEGRPWVLTPSAASSARAIAAARRLVELCGAQPVTMTPERHDEAVALVSHVPQLMASLTAARLAGADEDLIALSGQGIRDVTRIAASDPALWTEIVGSNAPFVREVLASVLSDLSDLVVALGGPDKSIPRPGDMSGSRQRITPLTDLLERGNAGQGRIPGKHGAPPATYTMVPVVVPDSPGELARLLVACGDAGINVEDVSIEHSPGQPVGLVEIAVKPAAAQVLADALRARGWSVHF